MPDSRITLSVDPQGLTELFQAAKAADGNLQIALRRGIKNAARPIVDAVRSSGSFSSRIPAAVKVKASFAKRGASIKVIVDSKIAPEAAPINNQGQSGTFRHPVFADKKHPRSDVYRHRLFRSKVLAESGWTWTTQTANPFFDAGVRAGMPAAEKAIEAVVDEWIAKLGFH